MTDEPDPAARSAGQRRADVHLRQSGDDVARVSTHDGAIYRDQSRQSGLPVVLPDGRFLRIVLRRCRSRLARARHHADQARQASRGGHSDVRRAGRARRRISASPDRARPPGRRLRADRRSGRSDASAAARAWCGAMSCGWSRPARSPKTRCSTPRATIICWRWCAAAPRPATTVSRWPGSTFRPANSASPNATAPASAPRLRASSPARSSFPTRFMPMPELAPILRALPAVMPLTRDVFDGATAERRLSIFFGVATTASFGAFSRVELTAAAAAVTYIERTQLGKRPPLSLPARESSRRDARDRSGDARQSRTHPHHCRRAPRLAARRHRPHADLGRRAAAGAAARRAADRSERDRASPRHRQRLCRRQRRARRFARAAQGRARSARALWRGSPSPAAARAISPRSATAFSPRPSSRRGLRRWLDIPRELTQAIQSLRRPDAAIAAELAQALTDELPAFRRDGGFVRAGYLPALDEARALRDESRRVIAALQSAICRDHRHPLAQDQAQ